MEKVNKKVIVIIFAMLFIAATVMGVLIASLEDSTQIVIEHEESNNNKDTEVSNILKLTDMYNENDLIIEDIKEKNDKVEIEYVKISGLKNKSIEEKVNKLIKEKIDELISKIPADGYDNVYINGYVSANFGNVLSIHISGYVSPYTVKIDLDSYGINIDLTTGNILKVQDLFNSEEEFYSSIRNEIYLNKMSEIEDMRYWIYDEMPGYDETIASIKEKRVYFEEDVLSDFLKVKSLINEDVNFYFYNRQLYFTDKSFEKLFYGIDMEKNYKKVAIYTKYLTKDSIFENDGIGRKNLFVFSNRRKEMYYSYQEKISDNLYVDFMITDMNYKDVSSKINILEQIKTKYNTKIEELKSEMKEDKNKAKAVFIYCEYNTLNDKYALINLSEKYTEYEMSSQYYKDEFMDVIASSNRYTLEDRLYIFLDDNMKQKVSLYEDETKYFWNTNNNTKVEKSSDIFKNEELYENAMQSFLKDKWQEKYGVLLSPEELIEQNKNTTTELMEWQIYTYENNVSNEDNGMIFKNSNLGKYRNKYGYDEDYEIEFSYFDENALNIMK